MGEDPVPRRWRSPLFHATHGVAVGYPVVAPPALGVGMSVDVISEAPQSFEQNPVETGLVDSAEKYPDSSGDLRWKRKRSG